ncbi:hypothetical protein BVC93_25070 [Mycobacterium sp. MS1601]|uniref:carboxymuconolactone decarboxylase family protein n=1 Tax=Mycobacterium sp. MS1601 TaxID=1936029 RepID=UPI0009791774|nr:carboxymuconolactone decarboxylase family protein [Mycobacterium sp. MS1601]AQA05131.1 hypothetical protein BVC93_25070 [Mycobacterium sp. MS1601]
MNSRRPSHHVLDTLWPEYRALRQLNPTVHQALDELREQVMLEGALTVKDKELIALAIAVVQGGDAVIAANARNAVAAGVTEAEAAEAIGVAVMMQSELATMNGARAVSAFSEFEKAVTRE